MFDYGGILSCAGSDGPDIYKNDLEGIPFNVPYAIEEYLIEEGCYESGSVMMGRAYYNAPVIHYIDWLEQKGLLK